MDNRGVTPVVEKLLTIGIVVLFIGGVTAVLFGSAVPGYRTAVGAELGDRVAVSAAEQVERAVPPKGRAVAGRTSLRVPETIRGEPYTLRADGRTLVLAHPNDGIETRIRLSLPGHVTGVTGSIDSQGPATVVIEQESGGVVVRLGGG